jgi:RHS repeat-associated protein
VAAIDVTSDVFARLVYASRANVPDYVVSGGEILRIASDHVGSPRVVFNVASGNVRQSVDYDAFGNMIASQHDLLQPFGFTGGIHDATTGLVRLGARDYSAPIGRWTTKDPIVFDSGEHMLYVYPGNDPINFVDQDGLMGSIAGAINDGVNSNSGSAIGAQCVPYVGCPPNPRPGDVKGDTTQADIVYYCSSRLLGSTSSSSMMSCMSACEKALLEQK